MLTQTLVSSAKFMKLMLCSQLSCSKLHEDQLKIDMTPLEGTMLSFINEFLKPYQIQADKDQITFELELINKIPREACTDWVLYAEILFHLIQNATKFTPKGGHIKIRIS